MMTDGADESLFVLAAAANVSDVRVGDAAGPLEVVADATPSAVLI